MEKVEKVEETGGHFFRSLFKLALVAAIIGLLARLAAAKKKEYSGLTVSEARAKVEEKLGPRLGEETAAEVAETVVGKLRERGLVVDDPITDVVGQVANDLQAGADELGDKVSEAAEVFKEQSEEASGRLKDKAAEMVDDIGHDQSE